MGAHHLDSDPVMISLMRAAAPTVSIVVVGRGDAPKLLDCLESVAAGVHGVDYEVSIVLNEPTEELRRRLEREVAGAQIVSFRSDLGLAGASNYAVERSAGTYLAFLRDDCLVQPGWLSPLMETLARRPKCGIVSATVLHPDGRLREAGSLVDPDGSIRAVGDGLDRGYMAFEHRIVYGSATCWLVRRETWEQVGGFAEAYYPACYEDVDLCLSASEAGWETWYQPRSVVVHSPSSDGSAMLKDFIREQSRRTFLSRWGETLSDSSASGTTEEAVWRAMGSPHRVLVIDDMIPDPSRGSGYGRMYDNLASMVAEPHLQVVFHPRMVFGSTDSPIPGVRVVTDLAAHLQTAGVGYDVAVVSRPHNAQAYRSLLDARLPRAIKVYDAEALFHRRLALQASLTTQEPAREALAEQAEATRQQEADLLNWADRVVCISEEEAEVARGLAPTPVVVVSPLLRAPVPTPAGFRSRTGVGLVAGWNAGPGSPNSDGLLWFCREVLPRVRAHYPGLRLRVTGHNPPPDVRWLADVAVDFVGEVVDLAAFYNDLRVAISPTRFGAGVKVKSVEAIQFGVPVVCTEEAASGLPQNLRQAARVAYSPAQFADNTTLLLSDERAWERQRSLCLAYRDTSSEHTGSPTTNWGELIRNILERPETVATT